MKTWLIKWALKQVFCDAYYYCFTVARTSKLGKKYGVTEIWLHEDDTVTITISLNDVRRMEGLPPVEKWKQI